jgi:hypothetical protein
VILVAAFVWIDSRGVEDAPWVPQGLRFGVAVVCLTVGVVAASSYRRPATV